MKSIRDVFMTGCRSLRQPHIIIIIYIFSLVDCIQNGQYNLKQCDHYKILNELVHITLLYSINICAE